MEAQIGIPRVISTDMATTDMPYTEPTDRSISPETITMVMPTARIPRMETCRTMFIKLSTVRNTRVDTENTRTRITSPAKIPISLALKSAARGLRVCTGSRFAHGLPTRIEIGAGLFGRPLALYPIAGGKPGAQPTGSPSLIFCSHSSTFCRFTSTMPVSMTVGGVPWVRSS